jgi:alanine racemase
MANLYGPVYGRCNRFENEVSVGDEVVLFGKQGESEIRIEDIARSIGTINYEIVSIIGKRIPRVYLKDGKIQNVLNYLVKTT